MKIKKEIVSVLLSTVFIVELTGMSYAQVNSSKNNIDGIYFSNDKIESKENLEKEESEEIPLKDYGCSEELNKILSSIEFYLKRYKETSSIFDLYYCIDLFGDIALVTKETDAALFDFETVIDKFFIAIRDEIYLIVDEQFAGEMILDFAEEMLYSWRQNKEVTAYMDFFMARGLVDYNVDKIKFIQEDLDYLYNCYVYLFNTGEPNTDSEELPDVKPPVDDSTEVETPDMGVEQGRPPTSKPDEDVVDKLEKEEIITVDTYYKKVGNSCTIVERKYKEGHIFEQTSKPVPKEDYVYCGINDYIFSGVNINEFENDKGTIIDKDYLMNNQNEESNKYVYYTVNKDSFSPYYYNTGIRATMNETLSYNQLKDVFYQIAITTTGFSIDTNSKSLTVLEGRPVVLRKEKDIYDKKEIESLLDSFKKVDIIIDEDNEVMQNSLDELITNKDLINIVGDGKDFKIRSFYKDGNYITVSVQELMGHFGYNVKYDKKKDELIVSKDDFKLVLKKSTPNYILNGEKGRFPIEVKNIAGDWYVDFDTIMDIMGYDISWNEKDLVFKITKNKK